MTMRRRCTPRAALLLLGTGLTVGCGGSRLAPVVPKDPTPLAKCGVAKSASSPLVTEWPASEKAHLETLFDTQAVVVKYSGCEMRILDGCRVEGTYDFRRTTLSKDTIEIDDVDELYTKVPLGAANLEADLQSTGRLAIRTTVIGQMRLASDVTIPRTPACEGATHVVNAVSVGAFDMVAGGAVEVGGALEIGDAGAGARTRSEESQLRSAGNPARCAESDEEPHPDCRSPLQVFLIPAQRGQAIAAAVPAARVVPDEPTVRPPDDEVEGPALPKPKPRPKPKAPPRPASVEPWDEPPPEASVEVHFEAPDSGEEGRWMVLAPTGDVLCELPCTRRIGPQSGIRLQLDAARQEDIQVVPVPGELGYTPGRRVRAVPDTDTSPSAIVPAIVTAVGVAGLVGGVIMLSQAGLSGTDATGSTTTTNEDDSTCDDARDPGLCTGGIGVTAGGTLALLVGGVWLWAALGGDYPPELDLTLIEGDQAGVMLGPSGLHGRF